MIKMSGGTMWIAVTFALGVVAYALFLVVIPWVEKSGPVKVDRHFERSLNYLPLVDRDREAAAKPEPPQLPSLREFAQFRSEEAAKYVFPILFPLDFIMMAFMTAFLVVGCVTFGSYVPGALERVWLLIALPILYFLFDVAEDALLAWFLKNPSTVSFDRVNYLKLLTAGKLITLMAAHLELVVLAFAAWPWSKSA
jgi:hypothetical protein